MMPLSRLHTTRQQGFVHIILIILFLLGTTTFGVLATQTELLKRKAQSAYVTSNALDETKRGLLEFAKGNGMQSGPTRTGLLPQMDFYNAYSNVRRYSRPGQLPCPDYLRIENGANNLSRGITTLTNQPRALVGTEYGNEDFTFDGVADYHHQAYCLPLTSDGMPSSNRIGRVPWREYFDFVNVARAVNTNDPRDGFGSRLWYIAAAPFINSWQPLNRYLLRQRQDQLLTVHIRSVQAQARGTPANVGLANNLTISDVAAIVFSPGTQAGTARNEESIDSKIALFVANNLANSNQLASTLFINPDFPTSLITTHLNYQQNVGSLNDENDRLTYITLDEVLGEMDVAEASTSPHHLDVIADALAAYYARNKHLPEPTTFEQANSDYLTRRHTRPAAPIDFLFNTSQASPTNPYGSNISPPLRGARIETETFAVTPGTAAIPGTIARLGGLIPIAKINSKSMPEIYLNPLNLPTVGISSPAAPYAPPYGADLFAGGSLMPFRSVTLGAVIPAYTPLRAARAFFVANNADITLLNNTRLDPLGAELLSRKQAFNLNVSGNLDKLNSNEHNVLFADYRPGILNNLARYGYSIRMPADSWLIATVAITIIGRRHSHEFNSAGELTGPHDFSFTPILSNSDVFVGTFRDRPGDKEIEIITPTGTSTSTINNLEPALATKTPLLASSQGLLPTRLLPEQTVSTISVINEALTPGLHYLPTILPNNFALIEDSNGAYGFFPVEVTMHALISQSISRVRPLATQNPPELTLAISNITPDRTFVLPQPSSTSSGVLTLPPTLHVGGIITFPVGSRIYYPPLTKIPLGPNSFNHGHNAYNLPVPYQQTPTPAVTVRARAYLAPGAVLGNVSVSGQMNISPRMTLANGGILKFDQLLHYTDGGLTVLPWTVAQRAFRIESMGLSRTDNATNINVREPFLDDLDFQDPLLINNIGYHLYPYHGAYEVRSLPQEPILRPNITGVNNIFSSWLSTNPTVNISTNESFIDNPVARADLWLYNAGVSATIPLLEKRRTAFERNTLENSFGLVDRSGIAIEEFTLQPIPVAVGQTQVTVGQRALPVANATSALSLTMSLQLGRGVRMVANPGRMRFDPLLTLPTTVTLSPRLALQQFNSPSSGTPLHLLTPPNEIAKALAALTVDHATGTAPSSQEIDARGAELALHFSSSLTVEAPTFATANIVTQSISNYSDEIDLGADYPHALRAIFNLNADALYSHRNNSGVMQQGVIPAGTKIEYGWLENTRLPTTTTSDIRTSYFAPNARIFNGMGYYPVPQSGEVRPYSSLASFINPPGIYIALEDLGPDSVNPALMVPNGNVSIVYMREPELYLPAPKDYDLNSLWQQSTFTSTVPNHVCTTYHCVDLPEEAYLFTRSGLFQVSGNALVVGGAASTSIPTVLQVSMTITVGAVSNNREVIVHPFFPSEQDKAFFDYQFILANGGYITSEGRIFPAASTRTSEKVALEYIQPGQILRLRQVADVSLAQKIGNLHIRPTVGISMALTNADFTVQPLAELSWSKRDGGPFNDVILEPSTQIFMQNHPIFYAVADDCRQQAIPVQKECAKDSEGLKVAVQPGEHVRLGTEQISPNGLIIHPNRLLANDASDIYHNSLLSVHYSDLTQATQSTMVAGLRLRENGQLQILQNTNNDPYVVSTDNTNNLLQAFLGSTVTITPGNQGLLFQVEPVEATSYTLRQPLGLAVPPTHTQPLQIRVGGFTSNNKAAAAYKVTVASGDSFIANNGLTMVYSQNNILGNDIRIGLRGSAPSSRDSNNAVNNLAIDGMHYAGTDILDLNFQSEKLGHLVYRERGLPEILSTIPQSIPATILAASANNKEIILPLGTILNLPARGYAMQGLVSGPNVTLALAPGEDALKVYSRNYSTAANISVTINSATQTGKSVLYENNRPLAGSLARPRALLDLGIPTNSSITTAIPLINTSNQTPPSPNITVSISGLGDLCILCQNQNSRFPITIDLRNFINPTTPSVTATTQTGDLYERINFINLTIPILLTFTRHTTATLSFSGPGTGPGPGFFSQTRDTDFFSETVFPISLEMSRIVREFYKDESTNVTRMQGRTIYHNAGTMTINIRALLFQGTTSFKGPYQFLTPNAHASIYYAANNTIIPARITTILGGLGVTDSGEVRENAAIVFNQFGNQDGDLTLTVGSKAIKAHRSMAIFGNFGLLGGGFTTLAASNSNLSVANNLESVSQLFIHGDHGFATDGYELQFTGVDELALQLPNAITINGVNVLGGSMIFPISGRVLLAKPFPTETIITLTGGGAVGNIVAGGGAGKVQYIDAGQGVVQRFSSKDKVFLASLEINYQPRLKNLSDHPQVPFGGTITINATTRELTGLLPVGIDQDTSAFASLSDVTVTVYTTAANSLTTRIVDTRQAGGVLIRTSVTLDNGVTVYDPSNRPSGQSPVNFVRQRFYESLPELHRLNFKAGTVLTIRAHDNNSTDNFKLPTNTTVIYTRPTTANPAATAMDDVSGMLLPPVLQPANTFKFKSNDLRSDGTSVTLVTLMAQAQHPFPATGPFAPAATNYDSTEVLMPVHQNLWIRLNSAITIITTFTLATSPVTTTITLATGTVINPLLGTYLEPSQITPAITGDEYRFDGSTTVSVGIATPFAPPALILPPGSVLNSGSTTLNFIDVQAVIAHSPAPLPENTRIDCTQSAFGYGYNPTASTLAVATSPSLTISQLREGHEENLLPDTTFEIHGNRKFPNEFRSYGHPCVLLDVFENYDGDNQFIYTNGSLFNALPPSSAAPTTPFSVPTTRVNDIVRMVGGQLN